MKVLLLANDTTYVYNLRQEVIAAMLNRGWQVSVMCDVKQHGEALERMGCRLIPMTVARHGKNPLQDLALLKKYKDVLTQEKPDAVLTYNIKPNVYGGIACTKKKIPYLVNVCGLGTPVETPGLMQLLTVALYRIGVKNANCVFFQNTENEKFFNDRNMAPGRHHLLPGSGVNVEKYPLLDYPKEDVVSFLYVSRVMKEKGIDQYLDAAREIHKKYPDTLFHVVGGCDDESYLEKLHQLELEGCISYHGQQPDMRPFQKLSCCAVHPTYYPEGMSNVLLESAASGRPIITTNRSGCREVIDDGVNGYICKQKDSADLIRQIEKFLMLTWEQRRDMGLAGREKVEQEFDRQIVVRAYMEEITCAEDFTVLSSGRNQ